MANIVRVFGVAFALASNTSMSSMTIVVNDGTGDLTFNTVLPTLTAGTYTPHGWCAHIAAKIRQYIKDRCDATGAVTVKPVLANIDVSLGWPQSSPNNVVAGVNTSLPRLHIGSLGGAATVNGPLVIKSFAVNNATNGWASLFGWCEVNENRTANAGSGEVAAGVLNSNARFQPRYFYCVKNFVTDNANEESLEGFGDDHADGFGTYYEMGEPEINRAIILESQQRQFTGPMFKVGILDTIGSPRNLLNLLPLDSVTAGEALLNGMTGSYKKLDQLSQGMYLRIGKSLYPIRYKSNAGNVLTCYETIPLTYTFQSGTPVYCISEAHAMALEWRRTGLILPYDPDDATGQSAWMADAYVPAQQGRWVLGHERKYRIPIFSFRVMAKLATNPGFAAAV